jgi:tetratricopeptide (TPR) repeat protein
MTDSERIAAIERAPSLAVARRIALESRPGFEQALFDQLRRTLGTNIATASHIARVGEAFADGRAAWGHRFRAVRHRLSHRWLASANEYLRAEQATVDPVDGASMAVGAIDSFARAGRVARALREGRRIVTVLRAAARDLDAGRAALNLGNALLWHERVVEAVPVLREAAELLADAPVEQAGAWLGLSTAQIDNGTSRDVREPAERAHQAFTEMGMEHYASIAEQNLAVADLMAGRLDEALERLLRLKASLPATSEEAARNEQHIGETYLRLNMPVESQLAFRDALGTAAMARLPYSQAQCHLGLAQAYFALDRPEAGFASAMKSRSLFNRVGNRAGAALARAVGTLGSEPLDHDALERIVDELEAHEMRRKTAEVLFTIAESKPDHRAHARGERIVHRHGLFDMEWRMHAASARIAGDSDRLDAYRKMASSMWRTRAIHRSTIARQHFLRDKDRALREYLGVLLESPSDESVAEAYGVLAEARSVSLIDEIVFARRGALTPEQGERLQELREKLRESIADQDPGGPARRAGPADVREWRREWHEATAPILAAVRPSGAKAPDSVYVAANGRYYLLQGSRAAALADQENLDEAVKWLTFDLQEPLIDPAVAPNKVEGALERLAGSIQFKGGGTVMPDGALWRAPWAALGPGEPVVSLAPAFQALYSPAKTPKNVVVWYQSSSQLPHIEREVKAIVDLFPAARICGSSAEARESLRGGETDLLHVATHACMNAWNPMFSYLHFDDGPVFAAEIARGALRPSLVTMSACDSGSVSAVESNEPDGLVRAALALGPQSVVASAWPLDDRSSSIFTLPFYRTLRDGGCVLESVRAGRNAVRAHFPHPYYWGPMLIFGGYLYP